MSIEVQPAAGSDAAASAERPAPVAPVDPWDARRREQWHELRNQFAFHPHITITPAGGQPPDQYRIEYQVLAPLIDASGQISYGQSVSVHLRLGPGFPNRPPLVRPAVGVFHPNVDAQAIYFRQPWKPADRLSELITRIGNLLAYRTYDPAIAANPVAMQWVLANVMRLPLDCQADFTPAAGGGPAARIARTGPGALARLQTEFQKFTEDLSKLSVDDVGAQIGWYARRVEGALELLADDGNPRSLREPAARLLDNVRAMERSQQHLLALLRFGQTVGQAVADAAAVRQLTKTATALLAELDKLGQSVMPASIDIAMAQLPDFQAIGKFHARLPELSAQLHAAVASLGQSAQRLRAATGELQSAEQQLRPFKTEMESGLAEKMRQAIEAAAAAQEDAQTTHAYASQTVESLLSQASALRQLLAWREYADMLKSARATERQIMPLGSDALQAWFVTSSAGRYGPFQLEQTISMGDTAIAVRSGSQGSIQVIDAASGRELASGSTGKATVLLESEPHSGAMVFELTPRCDELLLQFRDLRSQSARFLLAPQEGVPAPTTWAGMLAEYLNSAPVRTRLQSELKRIITRWKALMADLVALAAFKQRLATWHMVQRLHGSAARLRRELTERQSQLQSALQKLEAIESRSRRDPDTGALVVPDRHFQQYTSLVHQTQTLEGEIAQRRQHLIDAAAQVRWRLSDPRRIGSAIEPELQSIAPPSAALLAVPMRSGNLHNLLLELQALLEIPLEIPPLPAEPEPVEPRADVEPAPLPAEVPPTEPPPAAEAPAAELPPAEGPPAPLDGAALEEEGEGIVEQVAFIVDDAGDETDESDLVDMG